MNQNFKQNDSKIINAWAMYDWANSAYALVITSAIFPIYYNDITKNENGDIVSFFGWEIVNSALFSYAISIGFLIVAFISPLLSSIADYTGNKKFFMRLFCYLGSLACMSMYFFDSSATVEVGIIALILASVGYSGSIVFYNAYLPIVATKDRHDQISAKGFSLGYVGSVLLLLLCLAMVLKPSLFGIANGGMAARFSFVIVGLWWFFFSHISFYFLPRNVFNKAPTGNYLLEGYQELGKVWQEIKHLPTLKNFLRGFFFYMMGLQTIMFLATLFGTKELELADDFLIMVMIVIQLIAIGGAYGFAYSSKRIGNLPTLMYALLVWMGVCVFAYFVQGKWDFLALAAVVGVVMGGTQALSRSTYAKMLPKTEDHASYFSFYDVCEKLAIVTGTFVFGLLETVTGSMRLSVMPLMLFFILAFIFFWPIRKEQF
ncbi:MAG: MFS transporter [Chitinophagales bacterium]